MPAWLVRLLKDEDGHTKTTSIPVSGGKIKRLRYCPNQTSGIAPVIAQLLGQDDSTACAYMCHTVIKHVSKLRREGRAVVASERLFADEYRWILWIPKHTSDVFVHYWRPVSRL